MGVYHTGENRRKLISAFSAVLLAVAFCVSTTGTAFAAFETTINSFECRGMTVPSYDGDPYEVVNNNETSFTEAEKASRTPFADYSDLDEKGRVGTVTANIDNNSLPTGERGNISNIFPTGWVQGKYEASLVSGGWLYNRSHLYAYSLGGADCVKNLCTGTRRFNVDGMFFSSESPVLDFVKDNVKRGENVHVLYRVTPVFFGEEMLPRGVLIEAESLETEDINLCVFCYNVQPGIALEYMTGENVLASTLTDPDPEEGNDQPETVKISSVKVGSIATATYTGKAIRPAVRMRDSSGRVLQAGTDYTAEYKNNIKPGRATITIRGAGYYIGSRTVKFYIKPKKMTIRQIRSSKRAVALTWKKHTAVTGYQVAYKKKGAARYKVLNVKSTSAKKVIKGLRKGKVYQVRLRAYKKVDGKTLYGKYSKVRNVRVR